MVTFAINVIALLITGYIGLLVVNMVLTVLLACFKK